MKQLAVIISLVILLTLSSCFGKKEVSEVEPKTETEAQKQEVKPETPKEVPTNSGTTEQDTNSGTTTTTKTPSADKVEAETKKLENEIIWDIDNLINDLGEEIKK